MKVKQCATVYDNFLYLKASCTSSRVILLFFLPSERSNFDLNSDEDDLHTEIIQDMFWNGEITGAYLISRKKNEKGSYTKTPSN